MKPKQYRDQLCALTSSRENSCETIESLFYVGDLQSQPGLMIPGEDHPLKP